MALLDFRMPIGAEPSSTSRCSTASHLLLVDVQQARNLKNMWDTRLSLSRSLRDPVHGITRVHAVYCCAAAT
jgi:hypothetical protein